MGGINDDKTKAWRCRLERREGGEEQREEEEEEEEEEKTKTKTKKKRR
jgi:hypothetical protein